MVIDKYKNPIDKLLAGFTITVMAMLVFCVVWQVVSRYILQKPSTMTDELARFSMIWVGLLGAAYATGKRRHLSIDLLTVDLKGIKKVINQVYVDGCVLLFSATVMVWGGVILVMKVYSTGQLSPAMQLPMAYIYAVLPLSGILICYYCVLYIIEAVTEPSSPQELAMPSMIEEQL